MIATIILIILAIYLFLYFQPRIDRTNFGNYILWYTHRNEINKGIFKKERRFVYLNKFKI